MKSTQPLVSIIINCYNGDKYLEVALNSVLNQTYSNWEIIFWDNKSTDKSAEIFLNYKKSHQNLKYHLAIEHTVLYEARNYAIAKASGDYIAFLDVDDWWVPNKLELQIEKFNNENIGLVCSSYYLVNERSKNSKIKEMGPFPSGKVVNSLIKDYFIHISTLVIRKKALENLEYICDKRFNIIGDLDLVIRIMNNWELVSIKAPLAYYRWHKTNTGFTTNYQISEELVLWVKENKQKFGNYPYFEVLQNKADWYQIIKYLYDNKKILALKKSTSLTKKNFLKVLFACLIPNRLLKYYL